MCFDPKQFNKNKDALMDCTNEFLKKRNSDNHAVLQYLECTLHSKISMFFQEIPLRH